MNSVECDLANVGYPVVDLQPDGSFVLTKPTGTGGAVNVETLSEQLLYEVNDPSTYYTPDVIADFTSVKLTPEARDTVHVSPAKGRPAPDTLKVSIAYRDGWTASGLLVVAGPGAAEQSSAVRRDSSHSVGTGRSFAAGVLRRAFGHGRQFAGRVAGNRPAQAVLRIYVRDPRRALIERFSRELAPLVTSGPPGVTGYTTGRPTVREVLAYRPALVPRHAVRANVELM
jgi:hypothetical protein